MEGMVWHRCHDKFLGLRGDFVVTLYNFTFYSEMVQCAGHDNQVVQGWGGSGSKDTSEATRTI